MKTYVCMKCDNKTHQKDSICVSCKIGIPQMYTELVDLMKKNKNATLRQHRYRK